MDTQTGRAGRDGLPANCILFYEPMDFAKLGNILQKEWQDEAKRVERNKMAAQMASYATSTREYTVLVRCILTREFVGCRQIFIVEYFGDIGSPCDICDNCKSGDNKTDFTRDSILLLQAVRDTGGVSAFSLKYHPDNIFCIALRLGHADRRSSGIESKKDSGETV